MNRRKNPYRRPLNALWGKLANTNGTLFLATNTIENYETYAARTFKTKYPDIKRFAGAALSMTDLTGPTDKGWPYHYPVGGMWVEGHEFEQAKDGIIRRFSHFSFAQGHEAFETFLLDTMATYLRMHQSSAEPKDIHDFEKKGGPMDKSQTRYWEAFVRSTRTYRGSNNEKLFKKLRLAAPELAAGEHKNTRKIDLTKWYQAASIARHAITHSRGEIEADPLNSLDKRGSLYFPCRTMGGKHVLCMDRRCAERCLEMFASYGFLVFKSLSKADGYPWVIIRDMKTDDLQRDPNKEAG